MSRASNTPEELSTLSALLSAYSETHPHLSPAELSERLLGGVAVLCDLQLSAVERLLGVDTPSRRGSPIRTTDLQAVLDQLCTLSVEDGLTGLWNRRYFDRRLEQEILRSKRKLGTCAVALVDVDHFKRVNDTYGHMVGDETLREIANVLKNALRATDDIAGRFGGEEFVVLLPDTDLGGGQVAAERLRKAINAHRFTCPEGELDISVSIGVSSFDASCCQCDGSEVLKAADGALYAAKAAGRNRVCAVHAPGCESEATGVTYAERDLLLR